ncbi:DUF3465 domain-containing protein [Entomobacter blattae]|uniref:DUF3465 domain-containing protein n=1 Tax=Entomobacter blattae TaxID=2762277 RepID=A0A7H1NTJ8_9PROT|nr:DUF3465 domain-containing protein [Entomobacter blattae]QNT79108.1 hypothetical protein JGUZn3_18940 [Entomobacter blattae]
MNRFICALLGATIFLQPLQNHGVNVGFGAVAYAQSVSAVCDNTDFHRKQVKFEQHEITGAVPVHICGKVVAVSYERRTRSGRHGYFYVDTGAGISIRIVSALDRINSPDWPWVKKGDYAEVVGRYYFDSVRRQGIDWTHHGTSRKWPIAGYVIINGQCYE